MPSGMRQGSPAETHVKVGGAKVRDVDPRMGARIPLTRREIREVLVDTTNDNELDERAIISATIKKLGPAPGLGSPEPAPRGIRRLARGAVSDPPFVAVAASVDEGVVEGGEKAAKGSKTVSSPIS